MSTFWSRARHVSSSCRCTLCNPSRTRAPNRVNLNTAPARRQPGFNDALTLFYGTIMAAALYTDASIKIGKRSELDEDILIEKKQAQALEESNRERLQALGFGTAAIPDLGCGITTSESLQPAMKELNSDGVPSFDANGILKAKLEHHKQAIANAKSNSFEMTRQIEKWKDTLLSNNNKKQQEIESRRSLLQDHILIPMMTALTEDTWTSKPTGRNAKILWQSRTNPPVSCYWLKRQEIALTLLIYQLKQYSDSIEANSDHTPQRRETEPHTQVESLDELVAEAELALRVLYRTKDFPETDRSHLQFKTRVDLSRHVDPELHRATCRMKANNAICEAFAGSATLDSTLKRVCQILADLKQPPDVHTFNILMINFNRLHCGPAAEMVWTAMRHCGLICNELGVAAILRTHALMGSREKFVRIARSIDVLDGVGIMPWTGHTSEIAQLYPELLSEVCWGSPALMDPSGRVAAKPKRYIRMPKNEDMYDALVMGYLQFGDLESAGRELVEMIRAGFRPSLGVIVPVMIEALQAKDSQTSKIFITSILKGVLEGTVAELREVVYVMAHIACQQSNLSEDYSSNENLEQINSFAMQNGLLDQPLQAVDLQELTNRQVEVIKKRSMVARRLEQVALDLHFDLYSTSDRTEERFYTMPQVNGRQPANLFEYSAANLLQIHSEFAKRRGNSVISNSNNQHASSIVEGALQWLNRNELAKKDASERANRVQGKALTGSAAKQVPLLMRDAEPSVEGNEEQNRESLASKTSKLFPASSDGVAQANTTN